MSAIWQKEETRWSLLSPSGFPSESELHDLVESAPHVLPLAGSPQLVVLGREVQLGGNYADLIAVEPNGRPTILEIKLGRNPEARRAVVAQILTYAAFVRGMSVETFEGQVLGPHLSKRGFRSIGDAISSASLEERFDPTTFQMELTNNLLAGWFRLVLVLDDAPDELVRLIGYLEAVTSGLIIDLVTVATYRVGETQLVVPMRIEPEPTQGMEHAAIPQSRPVSDQAIRQRGDEAFEESILLAVEDQQSTLRRLLEWARQLQADGLADLYTTIGTADRWALIPRVKGRDVGMIQIWNDKGASIQFARSTIERFAPEALPAIEIAADPAKVGKGTITKIITEDLLDAIRTAYLVTQVR